MRLPIIPPSNLNAEQKPLYDDMRHGIAANFQGFVNVRDDGALLGPWNPWIHEPKFGKPVGELTKAMVWKPVGHDVAGIGGGGPHPPKPAGTRSFRNGYTRSSASQSPKQTLSRELRAMGYRKLSAADPGPDLLEGCRG